MYIKYLNPSTPTVNIHVHPNDQQPYYMYIIILY